MLAGSRIAVPGAVPKNGVKMVEKRIRLHPLRHLPETGIAAPDLFIDDQALERAGAHVAEMVPHYGEKLGILVRAAKINPRPKGAPDEYDRIKPFFDAEFYFSRYPDIARVEMDPVWHYIRSGAAEGRDPSPLFSTKVYVKQHPKAACGQNTPFDNWLRYTRKKGKRHMSGHPAFRPGITAVLGLDRKQIQQHFEARHRDIRARLAHGELGRMVIKAAAIDPSLGKCWPEAFNLRILPFSGQTIQERICAIYQCQEQLNWRRAAIVLVLDGTPPCTPMVPVLLQEAIKCVGKDNVVIIDTARRGPNEIPGFPPAVRYTRIYDQDKRDSFQNRRLLLDFLFRIKPDLIIGSDSLLLWKAMKIYGKAMKATFRVAITSTSARTSHFGYSVLEGEAHISRLLPVSDLLICPDKGSRDGLIDQHYIPPGDARRIVTLRDVQNRKMLAELVTKNAGITHIPAGIEPHKIAPDGTT
ncbi:MAG: hypothetical protein GDA52_07475 [Rhodobacteraceae bacterium]|nr:hypothetical protein [Paracoccaceae bacterium]